MQMTADFEEEAHMNMGGCVITWHWAVFDLADIDALLDKGFQYLHERAHFVPRGDHEHGVVISCRRRMASAHDYEARLRSMVVDGRGDDFQVLQFSSERGAERCGVRMFAREGGGLAGAWCLDGAWCPICLEAASPHQAPSTKLEPSTKAQVPAKCVDAVRGS